MNERIFELAKQAGFENGHQDRNGNSLSDELDKFAELIVRECVKHIGDNMEYAKIETTDNKERFLEIFRVSGGFFINEIKAHFGVE